MASPPLPVCAVKITLAEPSCACAPGLARTRNLVEPSEFSLIFKACCAAPTTSRPPVTARPRLTAASLPEPRALFDTPTPISTSSPGVIATGTFGNSTRSPRTVVLAMAEAAVSSFTATAITRNEPLKLSGTV